MGLPAVIFSLALCLSQIACLVDANAININSVHYCVGQPGNTMWTQIRFFDANANALRFDALDENSITMNGCSRTGSGTAGSPWVVTTTVNLNDDSETNPCGVDAMNSPNGKLYIWVFKAYSYQPGEIHVGREFILTSTCNSATAPENGMVNTVAIFGNVPFQARARNQQQVTGPNTFAQDSSIDLVTTMYTEGADTPPALRGAGGYYNKECYSATHQNMQRDRERFIENGCPVPGASLASTGFSLVGSSSDSPVQLVATATATTIAGRKQIYVECEVAKCIDDNNVCCDDPCTAITITNGLCTNDANVQDTGVTLQTDFNVQDVPAQRLHAGLETSANTPVTFVNLGARLVLAATGHPFGIGSNTDLSAAVGFFVYSCRFSFTRAFTNPVTFVGANGCPVGNNFLNVASGYVLSEQLSDLASNLYVLVSGSALITVRPSTGRVYVQCMSGICTSSEHEYCKFGRCGSNNNIPNAATELGFQGFETTFEIVNPTGPAVQAQLLDENGNLANPATTLPIGKGLQFRTIVVPGGQGQGSNLLRGAAGTYVHSCVASLTSPDGTTEDYEVIDDGGCIQTEGTPITISKPCTGSSEEPNLPPFINECGEISSSQPGEVEANCLHGICLTPDNIFCQNRCDAGPLTAQSNALNLPGVPAAASKFTVRRRSLTAKRSEEIRRLIVIFGVLIPIATILGCGGVGYLFLRRGRYGKFC